MYHKLGWAGFQLIITFSFVDYLIFAAIISLGDGRDEYIKRSFYRTDSNLKEIPHDIPTDVVKIDLSENKIESLRPCAFYYLSNCTELDLEDNHLTEIKSWAWAGLDALVYLNLNKNYIEIIELNALVSLTKLEQLYLGDNALTQLRTDMWQGLVSLKKLELHRNDLTSLSSSIFHQLENLEHLRLCDNKITTIGPGAFYNLPQLTALQLQKNNLTTFKKDIFKATQTNRVVLPDQLVLQLNDNPLWCDQELCWLKDGEKEGWLTWWIENAIIYKPDCANDQENDWDMFNLNCSNAGKVKISIHPMT